jgi:hypothetical protein
MKGAGEGTLVSRKRKADEGRAGEEECHSGKEVESIQVHKCDLVAVVDKEEEFKEMSEEELGVWC